MRATVQKGQILPVLSRVLGITGRKTNLAITTNVMLSAAASSVTLSATDLETGFVGSYPAKVESQGNLAINARKFFEIVRDFPSEDILLNEIDNHWVEIGNNKVEYHIVGMNPEDFPEIPKIEDAVYFEIDSAALSAMISRSVIIGAAADDRRTHIIGVHAERAEEGGRAFFRMVSTDGSRLSKVDHPFDDPKALPDFTNALIPKKSLVEAGKFLENEGVVRIAFKDNKLILKKENETLVICLLEGEFPKYQDIIAKTAGNKIVLDRQLFLMMLKRMSILSSDDYKGVIFNFNEDKLTISSTNPEIGESKEEMAIDFKGKSISVMFNPRFFMDTLNVLDEENAEINIISEDRPCLIEGENDKTYISVIMPMRI